MIAALMGANVHFINGHVRSSLRYAESAFANIVSAATTGVKGLARIVDPAPGPSNVGFA